MENREIRRFRPKERRKLRLWRQPSLAADGCRWYRVMRSAERSQRLIPVRPDFLDCTRHATLDRVALAQPLHEHVSNQRTEQLKQHSVKRFRVEILNVQILFEFTKQNLDHCPEGVDTDHVNGIVR